MHRTPYLKSRSLHDSQQECCRISIFWGNSVRGTRQWGTVSTIYTSYETPVNLLTDIDRLLSWTALKICCSNVFEHATRRVQGERVHVRSTTSVVLIYTAWKTSGATIAHLLPRLRTRRVIGWTRLYTRRATRPQFIENDRQTPQHPTTRISWIVRRLGNQWRHYRWTFVRFLVAYIYAHLIKSCSPMASVGL
jgi:hypothetical protein